MIIYTYPNVIGDLPPGAARTKAFICRTFSFRAVKHFTGYQRAREGFTARQAITFRRYSTLAFAIFSAPYLKSKASTESHPSYPASRRAAMIGP